MSNWFLQNVCHKTWIDTYVGKNNHLDPSLSYLPHKPKYSLHKITCLNRYFVSRTQFDILNYLYWLGLLHILWRGKLYFFQMNSMVQYFLSWIMEFSHPSMTCVWMHRVFFWMWNLLIPFLIHFHESLICWHEELDVSSCFLPFQFSKNAIFQETIKDEKMSQHSNYTEKH